MLISAIAGILTGFIVSIPPLGPISFALISKGINNRIKEGLSIAGGAAFMDFIYCLVAFGGLTLIISFFPQSFSDFYTKNIYTIQIILTYAGCVIVFIYGLKTLRTKTTYPDMETLQHNKIEVMQAKATAIKERAKDFAIHHHVPVIPVTEHHSNLGGKFFTGVLLCLSSITLPASWIGVVGYLKGYHILDNSFIGGLFFSIGAFCGTVLWFYTLLKLITGNKHRINPKTINKLNVTAGIILMALGVFLFIKANIAILT